MACPVPIVDPRPQRALQLAHVTLRSELRALLKPERADAILEAALATVVEGDSPDPAHQLRCLVGAKLLDEVADLLVRVDDQVIIEQSRDVEPSGELDTQAGYSFDRDDSDDLNEPSPPARWASDAARARCAAS